MTPLAWLLPLLVTLGVASGQNATGAARRSPAALRLQLNQLQNQLRGLVFGLPLDISISTLTYICSTIMDLGLVQPKIIPDMSLMSFQLRPDACTNVSIPLTQARELWNTTGFHQDRPTVIFITGWGSTIDRSNSGPVAKAYACRNDSNFVVLDAANFITTLYSWSALNTEAIGLYVAQALLQLDREYVETSVHVIGHSLGAQIAGSTGRNYKLLTGGSMLTRVTGLDPANPCFYDGNELTGVRSGDAKYVDTILSNPGIAGTADSTGDGSFFVQGLAQLKSGCSGVNAASCSHQRAVDYYVESVYPTNTGNFLGRRCENYVDLWTGRTCSNTNPAIMGYAATDLGTFYVDANAAEPYGTHANPETFTSAQSTCGTCDAES
ncbi:vitellogenin-1 [Drosophila novamexicana]|uniref:vitellogenin-1 n=1 Tax=Drosophila novamexicana TaxID=47314 RepID=UPI0011E5FC17|nr:vitellogenin-1 [Drosophila novamexicana]